MSTQDAPFMEDASSLGRSLEVPEASSSRTSLKPPRSPRSSRFSGEMTPEPVNLHREDQRISLRAFLRTILQVPRIAESKAVEEFLTADPVVPNEEELMDIERRKQLDAKRIEDQSKFYEIARKRAQELDVYMEKFRRDIVESSKFNV